MPRLDSRLESLGEMITRAREQEKKDSTGLEDLAESHGTCAGNLADVTERLEKVEGSYSGKVKEFGEISEEVARKADQYKRLEKEYRDVEQEIASFRTTLTNAKAKREESERRLGEISERTKELEALLATLNKNLADFEEQKGFLTKTRESLVTNLSDMKKEIEEYRKELENVDENLRKELEKQAGTKAEKDFLTEVIRSYEGYSEGVKNVAQAENVKGAILGVLADLISSDEQYAAAVEAALRENLQHILVETTDNAVDGVRYLSENECGRAAFMPLDGLTGSAEKDFVPDAPGVIGPVYDFVQTEARFMPVVKRILGRVVIVDNLDTAIGLYKKTANVRYVTLAGEIVGSSGDIHGGRAKSSGEKTIGRMKKLKELTHSLEEVEKNVRVLQLQRGELSAKTAALGVSIGEQEKALEDVRNGIFRDFSIRSPHKCQKRGGDRST